MCLDATVTDLAPPIVVADAESRQREPGISTARVWHAMERHTSRARTWLVFRGGAPLRGRSGKWGGDAGSSKAACSGRWLRGRRQTSSSFKLLQAQASDAGALPLFKESLSPDQAQCTASAEPRGQRGWARCVQAVAATSRRRRWQGRGSLLAGELIRPGPLPVRTVPGRTRSVLRRRACTWKTHTRQPARTAAHRSRLHVLYHHQARRVSDHCENRCALR